MPRSSLSDDGNAECVYAGRVSQRQKTDLCLNVIIAQNNSALKLKVVATEKRARQRKLLMPDCERGASHGYSAAHSDGDLRFLLQTAVEGRRRQHPEEVRVGVGTSRRVLAVKHAVGVKRAFLYANVNAHNTQREPASAAGQVCHRRQDKSSG